MLAQCLYNIYDLTLADTAESMEVEGESKHEETPLPDSTVQTFAELGLSLSETKQMIALLCTAIVESPEENVGEVYVMCFTTEVSVSFKGIF